MKTWRSTEIDLALLPRSQHDGEELQASMFMGQIVLGLNLPRMRERKIPRPYCGSLLPRPFIAMGGTWGLRYVLCRILGVFVCVIGLSFSLPLLWGYSILLTKMGRV